MDTQIDLEQYGSLPRHVREKLATADKSQEPPQPSPNKEQEEQTSSEPQSQPNVIVQTQAQNEPPANQPPATDDNAHPDDDNEVKAWKGRLNKEQAEHKATSEKLLAEAEARQAAEREAKELREKYTALEQKYQQPAEKEQTQSSQPPQTQEHFTDEELAEIEMMMGATGEKFARFLRAAQSQQQPAVDVGKVVDERLAQERQRSEEQARQTAFGKAVQEQTPKLQGLLNDSAFIEFAHSEVIDFAGNTAAQLLNFVGANQRADLLPKVAELIAKFEQSRQPPAQQVTAPPSNKGAAVDVRSQGKKPKPSAATLEKMNRLMRLGQVDELKALQEKYDLD
ncbi:hypothetical protein BKG95_02350 [Rodentibacter pneumotropicus]|uniref:hypothetical protein n=1 Tax=Rodentibacter pneumotropicus TaxID=758 RepID=UPI0009893880|nr:hypothetical protein [Rodentibacter pneumotropicus]OOF69126.1 hypothetical protein BKG95_02350 [Rodentibacter pneumotropicus]